jgi:hypothetical protein
MRHQQEEGNAHHEQILHGYSRAEYEERGIVMLRHDGRDGLHNE